MFAAESHYFSGLIFPVFFFFFYVYFQIILPDLEHLIHHRLDSTISRTLETHLRETSHPISTSTFKVVLYFRVFFVCLFFTLEITNPCTPIYLYFNLSMGNHNGIDITQTSV